MTKKPHFWIGIVLLLVFAGFSFSNFKDTLTPYVSYEEARDKPHTVQVAGGLAAGSSSYSDVDNELRFTLTDEDNGDVMKVRYEGLKPANFEEAISIVAIGRYDAATHEFDAEKLLVKCPSKYQGLEETKEYG